MAKKPAAKKADKAAAKKGGGLNKITVLMILAALVPFSLPTVVLAFFGLLPTLGAWASEKGVYRYAWLCVGGLNFSGLVYFLFNLWFGVHTLDESFNVLSQGDVLLWAYGCAALGWALYMVLPPMVSSWLTFTSDRRIAALKAAQKRLVEEWGPEVAKKNA